MKNEWQITQFLYGNKPQKVDRETGLITGAAICTEGEAKGHGFFLDSGFIDRVIELGNSKANGVKMRFGHPAMSSSALGTHIGRVTNFRRDGQLARADIKLSETAKKSPNGDLFSYIIDMAENEPDMIGTSIQFKKGRCFQKDEKGIQFFKSPDDDGINKDKPVFVEIESLLAADMVDEPAANHNGLFSAGANLSGLHAEAVSAFLDSNPEIYEFTKNNPEILSKFLSKYESLKKQNKQGESKMAEKTFSDWKKAFGPEFAAEYFDSGKTFEDAQAICSEQIRKISQEKLAAAEAEIASLKAKLVEAEIKLSAIPQGSAPVGVSAPKESEAVKPAAGYKDKLAEFAASGMNKAQAVEALMVKHPELHAQWIAEMNKKNQNKE